MPKAIPSDEPERILATVALHPAGIGVDALQTALQNMLSRRTLQRRLAELVQQQRLFPEGQGRALRYRTASAEAPAAAQTYIPTSPEGAEIRAYIRQPMQTRRPVAYDIRFLGAYTPNHTFYLGDSLRAQLLTMGQAPDPIHRT